jgi:hypothetical protein
VIGRPLDPLPSVASLGLDMVDALDGEELDRLWDSLNDGG